MGIAILSGVIASIDSSIGKGTHQPSKFKWESHTSGTSTPVESESDTSLPCRFIACVNRREAADNLKKIFGGLRQSIEVVAGQNLRAVREADVVILWYVDVMNGVSVVTDSMG